MITRLTSLDLASVFLALGLIGWPVSATGQDSNPLLSSEPPRNLYVDSPVDCPDCDTFTIIVAEPGQAGPMLDAFRHIAERLGESHAGSIISREAALELYAWFDNHGCQPFEYIDHGFVVYVNVHQDYCGSFPFVKRDELIIILEVLLRNIETAEEVEVHRVSWVAKKTIIDFNRSCADSGIVCDITQATEDLLLQLVNVIVASWRQRTGG